MVVLNPCSGSLAKLGIHCGKERVAAACKINGIATTIAVVPGGAIAGRIDSEITRCNTGGSLRPDLVIVGGGDGSVRAAASVLAHGAVPLGILPLGTFNHYARDLGLPLELEAAVRVIAAPRVGMVDLGEVNGEVFVNNSSLGLYPRLVAERDRYRRQGPARWGAAALALCRVLWRLPRPRVRVRALSWQAQRRTTCLFIANNMYRLDAFASAKRLRLDNGELCLYMVVKDGRLALLQLAVRAFLGRLEPERDFLLTRLKSVEIFSRRRRLRVALDGESRFFDTPLHYRIRPRALRVIIPEPGAS